MLYIVYVLKVEVLDESNPKRALKLWLLSHWHIQCYCTKFSRISTHSSDPQVELLIGIPKDSHKFLAHSALLAFNSQKFPRVPTHWVLLMALFGNPRNLLNFYVYNIGNRCSR